MAYTKQGFVNNDKEKPLKAEQLIAMEDGIISNENNINSIMQFAPQIRNNYPRRKSIGEQIKILCFGSSWFVNTWWYLNKITGNLGINANITAYFMSGANFDEWTAFYNGDLSPLTSSSSRRAIKSVSENGADWVQSTLDRSGEYNIQAYRDDWYADITAGDWDLILFQQGAVSSNKWSYWTNYADLVSIIKRHCNTDTVIGFNCTWTPAKQHSYISSHTVAEQKAWQEQNNLNSQRFMRSSGIDYVSLAGTVAWMLRRDSTINNDSYDLSKDGLHLDYGAPMYAISLMLYECTIAPFYGIPFENCTWTPSESDQTTINYYRTIEVTDEIKEKIFKYIRLAISNRFVITEADDEVDLSNYSIINYDDQESGVNLTDSTGEYGSSSAGYVNIYNNIDTSKNYYATSYSPSTTSVAACVCYYDLNGDFISSQSGGDFDASSSVYTLKKLTVPSSTYTIKLFGRTDSVEASLYTDAE